MVKRKIDEIDTETNTDEIDKNGIEKSTDIQNDNTIGERQIIDPDTESEAESSTSLDTESESSTSLESESDTSLGTESEAESSSNLDTESSTSLESDTSLDTESEVESDFDEDVIYSIDYLIDHNQTFNNLINIKGKVVSINRLRETPQNHIYKNIILRSLTSDATLKITAWDETVDPLIKLNPKYQDTLTINGVQLVEDTSSFNYGTVNYIGNINLNYNGQLWLNNLYIKEINCLEKNERTSIVKMPIKNQMVSIYGLILEIDTNDDKFIDVKIKDSKNSPLVAIRFWKEYNNVKENEESKLKEEFQIEFDKIMIRKPIFFHGIYWNNDKKVATFMPSSKVFKVTRIKHP